MTAQCMAKKASGARCNRSALEGTQFCLRHAPGYVAPKRAAKRITSADIAKRVPTNSLGERWVEGQMWHCACGASGPDRDDVAMVEHCERAVRFSPPEHDAAMQARRAEDVLCPRCEGHSLESVGVACVRCNGRGRISAAAMAALEAEQADALAALESAAPAAASPPSVVGAADASHALDGDERSGAAVAPDPLPQSTGYLHPSGNVLGVRGAGLPEPLYDDGRVTLYCGDADALLDLVIERHGRPHHVLTDPPYGPRVVTGARTSRGTKDVSAGWIGADAPRAFVPFAADADTIRSRLARANPSRWSFVFCDHVHAAEFEVTPPEGLRHVRTGAWVKPDCAPQMNGLCPANGFESIAILHSGEAMRWNSAGKRGVWTHGVERDQPWHPTPKPWPLIAELIEDFADPGDLVLDMHSGSGVVGAVCRAHGRCAVLIEIDPTYARLAAQRIREGRARPVTTAPVTDNDRTGQLALIANG